MQQYKVSIHIDQEVNLVWSQLLIPQISSQSLLLSCSDCSQAITIKVIWKISNLATCQIPGTYLELVDQLATLLFALIYQKLNCSFLHTVRRCVLEHKLLFLGK
jgi:hypothetical protein